jgi:hypothetical protein
MIKIECESKLKEIQRTKKDFDQTKNILYQNPYQLIRIIKCI